MKRLMILLLLVSITCTACTALPAEERAFAVVLGVEKEGATWRMHGRIPTYQTGGGYLTVTGEGETIAAALASLDAAAPMHLHLSQLRLLVLDEKLGQSEDAFLLLHELSDRLDIRQHCAVAVTDTPMQTLMEALKPVAGARLSKAVDILLDTRAEQGMILPATLADVIRMGERQSPVLIALALEGSDLSLAGGYPVNQQMRFAGRLTPEETELLSLLRGEAKSLHLTLPAGSAQIRDVSAKVRLSEDRKFARVELSLRAVSSTYTPEGLAQALADACLPLLARLSREGCDALGLGRQAILRAEDMAAWHALNWPDAYPKITWSVAVQVQGPA